MYDILGLRSAAQRRALGSVASTYAENTNRMTFETGVRFLELDISGSAAVYLYVVASATAIAVPATALDDAALRKRVTMKTKANGGTQARLAFNFAAKYVYFLTESGTADIAADGFPL